MGLLDTIGKNISSAFGFGAVPSSPSAGSATYAGENKDLRVRLGIPPAYLGETPDSPSSGPGGILKTNKGIIFPYTPEIQYENSAEYSTANPLHSNFPLHFFKHASVGTITLNAKFTAQTEYDGAVILGVINVLRTLTKMKWGLEDGAGSPPPVCRLYAYGTNMLNNIPVVLTTWRQDLPSSVDYITVGRNNSKKTYGVSMVPTLSTFILTFKVAYSRQEMMNYTVKDFVSGNLKNKGYL